MQLNHTSSPQVLDQEAHKLRLTRKLGQIKTQIRQAHAHIPYPPTQKSDVKDAIMMMVPLSVIKIIAHSSRSVLSIPTLNQVCHLIVFVTPKLTVTPNPFS